MKISDEFRLLNFFILFSLDYHTRDGSGMYYVAGYEYPSHFKLKYHGDYIRDNFCPNEWNRIWRLFK